MKIKVEWKRETEGVSEVEVPEAEVADWLNENGLNNGETTPGQVTAQDCFDWLQSGDDDVWIEQIDTERDQSYLPWNDVELERLHVDHD